MSVYKTVGHLLELKYKMDKANICDADRAVVLDREFWQHIPFCSDTFVLGFRVIWREVKVIRHEEYHL